MASGSFISRNLVIDKDHRKHFEIDIKNMVDGTAYQSVNREKPI